MNKVDVVTVSDRKPGYGGVEKVEKQIVNYLDDAELFRHETVASSVLDGFPGSETLKAFVEQPFLLREIRKRDPDVVVVPVQSRLTFDPDCVDASVVVYVHDLFPVTHFFKYEQERGLLYKTVGRMVGGKVSDRWMRNLLNADLLLTPSSYVKNDVLTRTPFDGTVMVAQQGVDDLPKPDLSVDTFNRPIDLLYVGGTHGRKNPEMIKNCLEAAEEQGLTVATVTGRNDLPGTDYGTVSDEELADLYGSSKYVLQVSYAEGFGRVPLEAQRYGCIPLCWKQEANNHLFQRLDTFRFFRHPDRIGERIENWDIEPGDRIVASENAESFKWKRFNERVRQALVMKGLGDNHHGQD